MLTERGCVPLGAVSPVRCFLFSHKKQGLNWSRFVRPTFFSRAKQISFLTSFFLTSPLKKFFFFDVYRFAFFSFSSSLIPWLNLLFSFLSFQHFWYTNLAPHHKNVVFVRPLVMLWKGVRNIKKINKVLFSSQGRTQRRGCQKRSVRKFVIIIYSFDVIERVLQKVVTFESSF